jgi:integrase core domain protein
MEVLKEKYGEDKFSDVFKTVTADNGSEFKVIKSLEKFGVQIYFTHPYSSWERAQNERHNRLFRRYVPKGVSIENYTDEQIMWFADEMNDMPRRQLGYSTPAELFDEFLNQVYSVIKVHVA